MKNFLYLLFIGIIPCCDSNNNVKPLFYCSLKINGELKEFIPSCISSNDRFTFYFDGFNNNNFMQYELIFGQILTKEYKATSFEYFSSQNENEYLILFTLLSEGHVIGNIYMPLTSDSNYLSITELDLDKKEIKGSFEVALVVDSSKPNIDPFHSDTLYITEGKFYTEF